METHEVSKRYSDIRSNTSKSTKENDEPQDGKGGKTCKMAGKDHQPSQPSRRTTLQPKSSRWTLLATQAKTTTGGGAPQWPLSKTLVGAAFVQDNRRLMGLTFLRKTARKEGRLCGTGPQGERCEIEDDGSDKTSQRTEQPLLDQHQFSGSSEEEAVSARNLSCRVEERPEGLEKGFSNVLVCHERYRIHSLFQQHTQACPLLLLTFFLDYAALIFTIVAVLELQR